ncbi:MAG: sulfite exporter TauE/SafE family protein, partial [Solirubrobacterales bacterium]|nr:sulfite exporter TauE/SafE family protein [Solirubrobacterales bacterium]
MNLEQELVVALLAGVSAFVAGLLGAGGDILFVPLLLYGLPALAGDPLDIQ